MSNTPWQQFRIVQTPQIAAGIGAGLVLGAASLLFSPLWVLAGLFGVGLILMVGKKPEIAILVIMVIVSTILPEAYIPIINLGVRFYISDIVLLGVLGLVLLRPLVDKKYKFLTTPLDLPILFFFLWAIFVTVYAAITTDLNIDNAKSEIRIMMYYLIFYAVTNLIQDKKSLILILNAFYIMASIVAVMMVVQYYYGGSLSFLPGRVEVLRTQGEVFGDITRITDTVGEGLITAAFITKTINFLTSKLRFKNFFSLAQWVLIGVGFGMTFNRAHWVGAAVTIGITLVLTGWRERQRFFYWVLVLFYLSPIIVVPVIVNPNLEFSKTVTAMVYRISSINLSEITNENDISTFRWRDFEYAYGIPQIEANPVLGIGLGAVYRPFILEIDHVRFDGRAYTHNGHLWIAMKTGLVGYFCLLFISIMFVLRGIMYWQTVQDPDLRHVLIGFSLSFIGIIIAAFLHPIFMNLRWTPIIGFMFGINEVIIRLAKNKQLVSKEEERRLVVAE